MATKWFSNKIIKHFRDKAVSEINANPGAVAKKHFSNVIDFLNQKYSGLQKLYWIGSYNYDLKMVQYFKECGAVTSRMLVDFPFQRNTEDEKYN